MEKYAKLMKGLEMCAGPECCKDGCPYYGETRGGKTCRAWLLLDAKIAINNEQALHESAHKDLEVMRERCKEKQKIINDLELELSKEKGKTDRMSVGFEELAEKIGEMVALAKYQDGRADALAAIVERCSFGGGGRHE